MGRDLIRLELKKLYEGIPPHITRYWNKYAVDPIPDSRYPSILKERNIAIRAKEITYAVVTLGERLVELAYSIGVSDIQPEDFVGLQRKALDYSGWWNFKTTEAISRHVPINLTMDGFLDRCMSLSKLIIEGLSESKLRRILQVIGVPPNDINKFGTLKLLDCVVKVAQVAIKTGLDLSADGKQIWGRLHKEGTEPSQPITYLFALYDIRIIKAHKASAPDENLAQELKRFDVAPGEEVSGYGEVLDKIYDLIIIQLSEVGSKIEAALSSIKTGD